jgi:hypothetical protein
VFTAPYTLSLIKQAHFFFKELEEINRNTKSYAEHNHSQRITDVHGGCVHLCSCLSLVKRVAYKRVIEYRAAIFTLAIGYSEQEMQSKTFRSQCQPHLQNIHSVHKNEFLNPPNYTNNHKKTTCYFVMLLLLISAPIGHFQGGHLQRNTCIPL